MSKITCIFCKRWLNICLDECSTCAVILESLNSKQSGNWAASHTSPNHNRRLKLYMQTLTLGLKLHMQTLAHCVWSEYFLSFNNLRKRFEIRSVVKTLAFRESMLVLDCGHNHMTSILCSSGNYFGGNLCTKFLSSCSSLNLCTFIVIFLHQGKRPPFTRPWTSSVPPLTRNIEQTIKYPTDDEEYGMVTTAWRGPLAKVS